MDEVDRPVSSSLPSVVIQSSTEDFFPPFPSNLVWLCDILEGPTSAAPPPP